MKVWAIADLHLSFGCQGKEMDIFGPEWKAHYEKIALSWDESVAKEDLVLLAGDISWAMYPEEARKDLEWIEKRPGLKVMIRGNHDYWWQSASKVRKILPPSIRALSNDAINFEHVAICGTRLWDSPEYSFGSYVNQKETLGVLKMKEAASPDDEKIFQREIGRLKLSLEAMNKEASIKICMTHYPPIGATLEDSTVSKLLEQYGVTYCIFGHLHSLKSNLKLFGEKNGISYLLTSCDYLDFKLQKVVEC